MANTTNDTTDLEFSVEIGMGGAVVLFVPRGTPNARVDELLRVLELTVKGRLAALEGET